MLDLKLFADFMTDFWKLIKSSHEIPSGEADQYWSDLCEYAKLLEKKYNGHSLVKKLLIAYLDYQEETWRTQKDM